MTSPGWRVPFTPPSVEHSLVVRTIDYGGEEHPATVKRTVVVAVARLPLTSESAIHNCKLIAGTRWTPSPPLDAGIGPDERDEEHGYIKISCEDYPQPGMNLKWVSDTLDKIVLEANVQSFYLTLIQKSSDQFVFSQSLGDKFNNVPLDTRHLDARRRKAKTGEHRNGKRPTLNDFPPDWLPSAVVSVDAGDLDASHSLAMSLL